MGVRRFGGLQFNLGMADLWRRRRRRTTWKKNILKLFFPPPPNTILAGGILGGEVHISKVEKLQ